jgi:KUP system potassium uptake protein
MLITTILANVVFRRQWAWGVVRGALVIGTFMVVDLSFFSANAVKIEEGGWFPLTLGIMLFTLMTTWKRGRVLLAERMDKEAIDLLPFVSALSSDSVTRVPGTAVYLSANPDGVPHAMLHTLKHIKVLHERIVILAVKTLDVPFVSAHQRLHYEALPNQFHRMVIQFGFMEEPNVPQVLFNQKFLPMEEMDTVFMLSRESLIPKVGSEMAFWREKLFITMFRNSGSAVTYFKLPSNKVIEIGSQVVL